jgi:hypothetical protein
LTTQIDPHRTQAHKKEPVNLTQIKEKKQSTENRRETSGEEEAQSATRAGPNILGAQGET